MRHFLLVFIFLPVLGVGQTTVSGTVKDGKGRVIPGVSIAIKDSYDGATADSSGRYSFQTEEKGLKTITASSIGYFRYERESMLEGSPLVVDIVLKEEPNELKAVVITAGAFEASDTKRATVLNPIDIVTTASANGDVTSALRTLPGAQQIGENEGLFVRGGTAGETRVFIDGTPVNNFFFSSVPDIAQRGRFSPFLFKGTVFSSGGYSALYGQALSSVVLLESSDLPERSSASVGLMTVGLSGGYQRLSKDKNSSWGGSYNYTNLLPYFKLVRQRPDYFRIPEFHNGDFNYRLKTSKTGMLKFYGYYNDSRLGLRRGDIDSSVLKNAFTLNNRNLYANLSWKEGLGRGWRLNAGLSYSTNTDDIENALQNQRNEPQKIQEQPFSQKSFEARSVSRLLAVKAVFEKKLAGLSMFRAGGEYFYQTDRNNFSSDTLRNIRTAAHDHLKAAFAEADIYLTNDLAAKIGSRIEHSSLLKKVNAVPRISLAYKLGEAGQFSLAYGEFYQKPESSFFLRGYRYESMQYQKATHYIANFQRISRVYTLRAEVFYKKYRNLLKSLPSVNGPDSLRSSGFGEASGFEIFWRDKKTLKNVDYWISYSFLDTRRNYLNYPETIRPGFAARHTASLVVKKFVTPLKTQFNGSYTFASGRPYYNIVLDPAAGAYRIADAGKTIAYNSLSISVNYLPFINKPGANKFTVFVFSVTNVLGSRQVFGYNYSYNGIRKEPVNPPANRFLFLGCFISFGVDRTEEIINSNL